MSRRNWGFTLVEMLIVVAIMGVLAAIAIPAYSKYAQRSRRSDAVNAIEHAAALEERYYFQNNKYGDSAALGVTVSPEGYYTITITNPNNDTQRYLITATHAGVQLADIDCVSLTLDNTGARTPDPDPNSCWHR